MDRRSWLWRRKSSEKSSGETESSGSASSHSERYSGEQEALRASPNDTSANHAQFPEVSSSIRDNDVHETVKRLTEKLSAAFLNISAKEDLVKQHAKVAEEAVSGWEQAEAEVAAVKQQLEAAVQWNNSLEYKISELEEALKECVRQLRHSKDEQEEKVHESITKKTHDWESEKHEMEKQLVEAKAQLRAAKTENATHDHGLEARLEAVDKENMALKSQLHFRSEELQVLLLERELSNKAAETASKQHLESIKKITTLDAECRRLQSINRKLLSINERKTIKSSVCPESLSDGQSDNGERLLGLDNELGCSDSWASALIVELDQFNNEKPNLTASVQIDLMDDFLEMERLAALPETDCRSSGFEPEARSIHVTSNGSLPKIKDENFSHKLIELEEKIESLEHERSELEGKRKELETQLELAYSENGKLNEKVTLLEETCEANRVLSIEIEAKLEIVESAKKALDSELNLAHLEVRRLNETVSVLECEVKEGRTLSSELASKVETTEETRKTLESQLRQAHSEIIKLEEKVSFLEIKTEEETLLSAETAIKLEASEAALKKLELELKLALEFNSKLEAAESEKKLLEIQLESAGAEIRKLNDSVALLEAKVNEERAQSAEYAAKCCKLESDLINFNREADLRRAANSKRELKMKQGKELAVAAGKLEECQKTIASLNLQLKSLTTLDDILLEIEMPEHNVGAQEMIGGNSEAQGFHHDYNDSELIGNHTFWNGREKVYPPLSSSISVLSSSSTSSNLSQFVRTLSHSRSTTC